MPTPDLVEAELRLTGRITSASNATFLGSIGKTQVVYKHRRRKAAVGFS